MSKVNIVAAIEDAFLEKCKCFLLNKEDLLSSIGIEKIEQSLFEVKQICPSLGCIAFQADASTSEEVVALLNRNDSVTYARQDEKYQIIEPTTEYSLDLADNDISQWHWEMTGITALRAKGFRGENIEIGLLDSGCAAVAGELEGKISNFIRIDQQYTVIPTQPIDLYGHGTKVGSIIAGSKLGVAPASKLCVASIAEDGTTSFGKIVAGLEWLLQTFPNMKLINMSVGKIDDPTPELEVLISRIRKRGILMVCAIGNDGEGITRSPADMIGALGVGAVNISKEVSGRSGGKILNRNGRTYVKPDLVMPGEAIPVRSAAGELFLSSGTSFAAPMLTGLAALLLEENPSLTVDELEQLLIQHCQDLPAPPQRDGNGLPVF